MPRVVISMQNYVLGEAVKMAMLQNGDFQVDVVEKPEDTAKKCFSFVANVALMEVTAYTPWKLEQRLKLRDEIKRVCPHCMVVLMVDENADQKVAQQVKQAKMDGLIDMFIYGSTSASYLVALIETL